jgi:hypothetical protein
MDDVMITKHNELIELKRCSRHARQIITCLLVDIKLPERISEVIITKQTRKRILSNKMYEKRSSLICFSYNFNTVNRSSLCSSFNC